MERGKRPKNIFDEEIQDEIKEDVTEAIENQSPAEVETTGPETINGTVINSLFVRVRKEPSFNSDVIDFLRRGDRVIILEKERNFYKVATIANKIAYISSEFIKEE